MNSTRPTRNAPLSVGDFLRSHRLGEGMSLTEFAEFLGISKQRLCDIEKDRFNMSLGMCKSLANKLQVPAEWLAKLALQGQIDKEGLKLKIAI